MDPLAPRFEVNARDGQARSGRLLTPHGLLETPEYAGLPAEFPPEVLASLLVEHDSPVGRIRHLAPAAQLSETPARWTRPAVPRGYHPPVWPERNP